ncbi:hypothetical protein I4U23_025689 [Adineta vaga]|nr:hypothetical protein I4U23_025689 [Adineta vaga]
MAKALLVTYLLTLSTSLVTSYSTDCAIGPSYWCQSLQNAEDCGAIRHCTDTIWSSDSEHASTDSSISCKWCQRILENTYTGLKNLIDNEESMVSKFIDGCKLLPSSEMSSKCTNMINNYGTSVTSLMKNKRYATICRLMSVCSSESTTERPAVLVGKHRCTWGPSYWCSSLSNSRECNSVAHCSNQVWSQQAITKKPNDNICQYCEYIIGKLRTMILNKTAEINIEKWLSGACSMLQNKDLIDKCVETMSKYADEIVVMIKTNIDPGMICHLGEMCKDATIVVRTPIDEHQSKEKEISIIDTVTVDEQTQMLCNIIVRATYELHMNQQKNGNEIQVFLRNDCQHLSSSELIRKCENLVDQRGNDIYTHVTNGKELSKICANSPNTVDSTADQSVSQTRCDLCTFALTTTKSMVNAKYSDDDILAYINEHLCSRLTGEFEKNCKSALEIDRKELIDGLRQGKQSILLCTYFQVCFEKLTEETSPIQKDEMRSFITENICSHLGPFKASCNALVEKDTTRLLKTLVNDIDGDVLCQMFGICPTKMSFLDNLAIKDDTNKCKRCIDDFTRKKHIAEKLLNHSTEFLHHFCNQLPQKDDCMKTVDESINKIVEFIRSLDPQGICVELKVCDQATLETIEPFQISPSDNIISEQVITYVRNDICSRLGSLSVLCHTLMESEGANLFAMISENVCPHKVCSILNVCPKTTSFDNCNGKCECCISKIENYQVRLASFLHTMLTTVNTLCDRMSHSAECRQIATGFESDINSIITRFNAKQICQTTHLCSTVLVTDTCSSCINRLQLRKDAALQAIDRLAGYFNDLCQHYAQKECQAYVKEVHDFIQKSIEKFDPKETCTTIGFCGSNDNAEEMKFDEYELSIENDIEQNICSKLGPFETLCKSVVQGDTEQIQTLKMNYDIKDLIEISNDETTHESSETEDLDNRDKCQCCIRRVILRKRHIRFIGDAIFFSLIRSCRRCPAKQQCRRHWLIAKARFDCHINRINPKRVCTHFGFCNDTSIYNEIENTPEKCDEIIEPEVPTMQQIDISNATCILCEYVMNILSKYINQNSTEEEIEQNLQKICNEIPSILQNQCHDYIDNYGPSIIATLIREFDLSTICHRLNLCTNQMKVDVTHIIKADTATCSVCNYLSMHLHLALKRDSNEKSFQHALANVCSYLSGEQNAKCQTIIQLFAPYISQLELSPENSFCEQLTICQVPMIDLKPAILLNKKEKISEINIMKPWEKESSINQHPRLTPTCTLCQYIISYLDAVMKNNKSEQAFEEALKKVCTILPSKERTQCDEFVKTYGPTLAQLIAEMADPKTVCHYLNMCQDSSTKKPTDTVVYEQTPYTCTICQYIVSRMKHFIGASQEKDQILLSIKESCDLFEADYLKTQCKTFLNQYGTYFLPMISNDVLTRSACQSLQICGETYTNPIATTSPAPISSSTPYGKCIFGMNYWCTNREIAKLCHAEEVCERKVWSKNKNVIYY